MTIAELAAGVRQGDRRALAKAITLIESTRDDAAGACLLRLLGVGDGPALRVAISGPPGVGKSTLIDSLGMAAVARGLRVAVLSVDPSSRVSGGSILGDKTRMSRLALHPLAFIRPTPAGTALGGVARRTRESLLLLEAAGFDLIFIETVGVGQSETEAAEMVDLFVLVLLPNAGDELQGIKRGIMEMAQMVLVNKADGPLVDAAALACQQIGAALALLHPGGQGWTPAALAVSARLEQGMDEALGRFLAFREAMTASGALAERRRRQALAWMWERVHDGLERRFMNDPVVRERLAEVVPAVRRGDMGAVDAAEMLLQAFAERGWGP